MSNLLFMDESNGNGVYATKSNNPLPASASTTTTTTTGTATATAVNNTSNNITATNNISNIMTAAATTTVTAAVAAATQPAPLHTSVSNEDLSQSLSEYTDADESVSAPTEFLAEFLSAVMLKDYKKALKYCKLILQYEPNNATAKEFYPLILEKLRAAASSDSDENYNKSSSSPELVLELQCSDPSAGESDEAASSDEQQACGAEDGVDEFGVPEDNSNFSGEPNSGRDSNSCASAADSLSVSVDEDDDDDDVDVDDDDDDDDDDVEEEEEDVISSSGDDLPNDDQHSLDGGINAGHDSHSSHNSSSGGGGRSRSDNTTHSYSSLLLEEEEEDDIVPVQLQFTKELSSPDLDVSNGNKLPSTSCSDSESPTEPLTQRLAAILRSKCGVSSSGDNY